MAFRRIKGILSVYIICGLFLLAIGMTHGRLSLKEASSQQLRFILDAGHGLPDGGAVGVDGTTEQELNLSLVMQLSEQFEQKGIGVLLTREDENGIYSEGETIHAKKVSDIQNRVKLAGENKSLPIISIHMNSFSNSSVHGIQVFYKDGDPDSKNIATRLQQSINQALQPENPKTVKPIPKNVYLFSHVDNPAVLIECGFVSNAEELQKLKTAEYQKRLAETIVLSLVAG